MNTIIPIDVIYCDLPNNFYPVAKTIRRILILIYLQYEYERFLYKVQPNTQLIGK